MYELVQDELRKYGFVRMTNRLRGGKYEETSIPVYGFNLPTMTADKLGLQLNGRYSVEPRIADEEGTKFDIVYDSTTQSARDKVRMGVPGFTVGASW
jgi:hypothetical protein